MHRDIFPSPRRRRPPASRGFTLLEMLVAVIVAMGVIAMGGQVYSNYADNTFNQSAADHAKSVAKAVELYVSDNYADLFAAANPTKEIRWGDLQTGQYVAGLDQKNVYGQQYAIMVRKVGERLHTLLLSDRGGGIVSDANLMSIAQKAGGMGGYVKQLDPDKAWGAFQGWEASLSDYGMSSNGSRVALGLFTGKAAQEEKFVHRGLITGRPELNAMSTPLRFLGNDVLKVVDDACSADEGGSVARDAGGAVLSCTSGPDSTLKWRRSGLQWKDRVRGTGDLPGPGSGRAIGDVRLVEKNDDASDTVPRAYVYSGSRWDPLGVDARGNIVVPYSVQFTRGATAGQPCSAGSFSVTNTGNMLVCRANVWRDAVIPENLFRSRDKIDLPSEGATNYVNDTGRPLLITGYFYGLLRRGATYQECGATLWINTIIIAEQNSFSATNDKTPVCTLVAIVGAGESYRINFWGTRGFLVRAY